MKIVVMAGLPGSGKTTLAQKIFNENQRNSKIWDLDEYLYSQYNSNCMELNLTLNFFNNFQRNFKINDRINIHILDGLFLNNKDYTRLIQELSNINVLDSDTNIEFCYFEPDKEACLWNDIARGRKKKANVTINNAIVERPDVSVLEKLTNAKINITDYQTIQEDNEEVYYQSFKDEFDIYGDRLHGEGWSKGGNWCDCWGGDYSCSYEDDLAYLPENFGEFRRLLNSILPNIDAMTEIELFEATVEYDEYSESDYYGGTQYLKRFECDVRRLYELLDEKELIILSRLLRD